MVREIPNGFTLDPVADQPLAPAIDTIVRGEPYVLFLGRINWKKGLDRLLGALSLVPAIRLVVAGNDEENYRAVLDPLAAGLGVSARVDFAGSVHGADKAALLSNARALILPSYSENFGNVVIEAMAAGCPVIVSKDVGLAETVRAAGAGLVVDGDPESLGAAMSRACSPMPGARPGHGRARDASSRISASPGRKWPRQMEELYASVLHGAGRNP